MLSLIFHSIKFGGRWYNFPIRFAVVILKWQYYEIRMNILNIEGSGPIPNYFLTYVPTEVHGKIK